MRKKRNESGVYIGTGYRWGECHRGWVRIACLRQNSDRVKPLSVLMIMSNASASYISIEYGLTGPCLTVSTACASSSNAIGEAFRQIRDGYADVMLAGGTEAFLTYGVFRSWEALRVLAMEDPDDPSKSCKPFSKNRSGLVLGEGAAVVVLEEMERAVRHGAPLYAEILGYGSTSDAFHMTKALF